jgi:hypothetical protein
MVEEQIYVVGATDVYESCVLQWRGLILKRRTTYKDVAQWAL